MESPVKAHMAPPFPPHPQPQMTHTKAKERRRKAEEGDDDHHEHKLLLNLTCKSMADKGRPLPKFGEWDVNDPSSAEGFTVIFNKARNEKKVVACLTHHAKMNILDIINMAMFLESPLKNGFAV